MSVLLIVVAVPFLLKTLMNGKDWQRTAGFSRRSGLFGGSQKTEVIAEFLKNDFNNAAFEEYQELLHGLVIKPHLDDVGENAKRRALLVYSISFTCGENCPGEQNGLRSASGRWTWARFECFLGLVAEIARGNFTVTDNCRTNSHA